MALYEIKVKAPGRRSVTEQRVLDNPKDSDELLGAVRRIARNNRIDLDGSTVEVQRVDDRGRRHFVTRINT